MSQTNFCRWNLSRRRSVISSKNSRTIATSTLMPSGIWSSRKSFCSRSSTRSCQPSGKIATIRKWFFLKMGLPWPLFHLFSVFSNKHQYNFTTNQCEQCPSSIQCWDSNPWPVEYESHPLTTVNFMLSYFFKHFDWLNFFRVQAKWWKLA